MNIQQGTPTDLLKALPETALEKLLQASEIKPFERNGEVFRPAENPDHVYVLHERSIRGKEMYEKNERGEACD